MMNKEDIKITMNHIYRIIDYIENELPDLIEDDLLFLGEDSERFFINLNYLSDDLIEKYNNEEHAYEIWQHLLNFLMDETLILSPSYFEVEDFRLECNTPKIPMDKYYINYNKELNEFTIKNL